MVFWMLGIAISVAMLVVSAAMRAQGGVQMAYVHMATAAAISTAFALLYIRETKLLRAGHVSECEVAANTARFMGLVWAWGGLALIVTYGTGILVWKEWWQFFGAFFVAAGLCLLLSATLKKDALQGKEDPTLMRIGRYLAIFQLVGMVATMLGLLIDGKMTRFQVPRYTDWAANNIFFFGALAIAAISAYALRSKARALRNAS
jgi:hypothetical protein